MPREEDSYQRTIVQYLRTVVPNGLVFSIPNNPKIPTPGMKAGFPDVGLILQRIIYLFEVKAPGGRLSKVQKQCHAELALIGTPVAVVVTIEDARAALQSWKVKTREATP